MHTLKKYGTWYIVAMLLILIVGTEMLHAYGLSDLANVNGKNLQWQCALAKDDQNFNYNALMPGLSHKHHLHCSATKI